MTGLDIWLQQATRRLAKASAGQVRTEIREHYESAREVAMSGGANPVEADRLALAAPGGCENRESSISPSPVDAGRGEVAR